MSFYTELERILTLYESGHVKRLHTVQVTKDYTVGQHVYGALVIANELCELNALPLTATLRVMRALLVHDAPELSTGDVPAPTKHASPEVDKALEKLEYNWFRDNAIAVPDLCANEHAILKVADGLELALAMLNERRLGNTHPMIKKVFFQVLIYVDDVSGGVIGAVEMANAIKEEWHDV